HVVRWDGRMFHQQDIGEWKAAYDLDADGTVEIETTFEMDDAGRCALDCDVAMAGVREIQYAPSAVWGWRDGGLTNVSAEVPDFYRNVRLPALAALREELAAGISDCGSAGCAEAVACQLECLKIVEARAARLAGDRPS
ncbi:MAG: hypothetical protein R6X25_15035, partial [Candidatus Krumholzibacteriia bacterium]